VTGLLVVTILIALKFSVWSQELDTGTTEYLSKCAGCHGADGKGAGPVSASLKTKPANLTTLAKRNHGVFSADAIYQMIDGRVAVRPHGSIEMPIWGCRHVTSAISRKTLVRRYGHRAKKRAKRRLAQSALSILDLPCDPETVIRDRILAVVEYLKRIQEE